MSPILINICSNPSEMALKNCSLKKEKPPKKRVSNFFISQILSENRDETHGTNSEHENSGSSPRENLRSADSPTCLKNEASASGSQSREDEITDCTRRWQDVNRITPEEGLVADGDMDDDCTTPNEEQPWDILNSFLKLSQNQKSSPVFENHAETLLEPGMHQNCPQSLGHHLNPANFAELLEKSAHNLVANQTHIHPFMPGNNLTVPNFLQFQSPKKSPSHLHHFVLPQPNLIPPSNINHPNPALTFGTPLRFLPGTTADFSRTTMDLMSAAAASGASPEYAAMFPGGVPCGSTYDPWGLQSAINNRRCRRSRTVFSDQQLKGLEKNFCSTKYLTTMQRNRLAKESGLTQMQVKTWYQNRRMKWKKQLLLDGATSIPTKPKGRPKKILEEQELEEDEEH
ncbi:uncharacterized protein LOC134854466 [Symsagittifera roscoffensis]|uniref:uncharacterized protein LOC134854466 n=1 Tax=Symsagittifera roscoffensis TaxID=84072 RepID=UPI00307B2E27